MGNRPVPENESERLRALGNYEILDSISEDEYDRITELATIICGTPISLITLLDEKRQWFKSRRGISISETARELAFCQYTILDTGIFEVMDATLDERFSSNDLVTGDPYIRFYAGFPLTDPEGYNLGAICVIDSKPNQLLPAQKRALELLATEVVQLIVERRQKEELRNFETLFKLSNDLICVSDIAGNFKKVNPAFHELLGWDLQELLQQSIFDLVLPEDVEITANEVQKLKSGVRTINFIHRIRTVNRGYKTIQWTVNPDVLTGDLFAVGRDISRQIIDAEKLKISEAKSRATFENSLGLVCTHDFNGHILTINAAGADILGYSREEAVTMNLYDFVDPAKHEPLKQYIASLQRNGRAAGQMVLTNKAGQQRILMFNNVTEIHEEATPYVICNGLDITERHFLEIELHRTAEMLEQTNNVAKVGGWQFNPSTQQLYWTSETRNIHGVGADFKPDVQNAFDFFRTDENREIISGVMKNAIDKGEPWNVELQIHTHQGKEIWVKSIGQAVMHHGVCVRLYGSFQDIDEKKKIELEIIRAKAILSSFVDYAPAAVAMLDNDMRYVVASRRWKEDYGLTGDVTGTSYYGLYEANDEDEERKARHQRILKGAVEYNDEDLHYDEVAGEMRYDSWEMRPWYEGEGKIGGMMIFAKDVTSLVQQREELENAKMAAEEANSAKSEFLANMSHEIRTPLNGVIGFTDLVLKTVLNETQQQYLTIVNRSANALLGIINDILDFSKIEAGKMELEIERCDLYELSNHATDMISFQVQEKGIEMLLNVPASMPGFIWADAIRMKQILVNLLGNAVKFTAHGEVELKIEVLARKGDQTTLRFSVRDTGIGIQRDKQEKIFEAFSQEDGSTTKKYGGTGLGLTITNKLLGLMGSKLQVYSTPEEGSIFFFDIIFKTEQREAIEWVNHGNIRQILVVDDNYNNRLILHEMLALVNIHTVTARNAFEALEVLGSGNKIDLILMDYHMPYIDGLEAVRKIRTNFNSSFKGLPVILLSSSPDNEKVIKVCGELAIHQRLLKPIRMQQLLDALSRVNEKKSTASVAGSQGGPVMVTDKQITILVAEDNAINMFLARTILRRAVENAVILEAVNGLQVIGFCEQHMPDLIFMDVQMPEMNGYEATLQIRGMKNGSKVPIIALTAGNVKDEREKCLEVGMNDFVVKPIIENTITEVLRKWLHDLES